LQLLIDMLQGAGLAGAAGIRPFLPALVAGALASANFGVDYENTPVVALLAVVIAERKGVAERIVESSLQGLGIGLGALLFAATLADNTSDWWPGLLAGGLCAALAAAATRSLVTRVRARLDAEARTALAVYVDGSALLLAALAIVVAPVSVLALGFFAFMLRGGKRREGEKYAGLRILR
jgi:hypothetical protein